MDTKLPCDKCEKIKVKHGKDPECQKCMPVVLPENENVLKIYQTVKQQYIMGFNGPIDINVIAIDTVINRYGIAEREKKDCFDRVVNICRHILYKHLNEQQKNTSQKSNNENKTFN